MTKLFTLKSSIESFHNRWGDAPDERKANNNTHYEVIDAILAALSVFFMQSSSFLAHQRLLQSKKGRNNATSLFKIEAIPSDQQVRNLLDPIPAQYFQADFWRIWDELNLHKQILRFGSDLGSYLVAFDGVTHFSSEKISCPECLKREDKQGVEHFYHSAITPVLVKPGSTQVLTLPPEFIVPQDGHEKQDCERTAVKRWLTQHHQHLLKIRSHTWGMTCMPTSPCAN